MKARYMAQVLRERTQSKWGRILVITGSRQTGKTTLIKAALPEYAYISVEDPQMRAQYRGLTATQWSAFYPKAALDEVQKEPQLMESIKAVYDQYADTRYALLGSSQLLLLKQVRESLAGRCIIMELFPLTLPELETTAWDDSVRPSSYQTLLATGVLPPLLPSATMLPDYAVKQQAWAHYQTFGGYPAVANDMTDDDRWLWLNTYVQTYLERDVRDLAAMRDLAPFVKMQQLTALQTGCLFNASSLSKNIGVSYKTVQRYQQYLELSFQTITLKPWERNTGRRLVKSPKVHYLDNGVLKAVLKKRGLPTGNEFESLVVAELYKQAKQLRLPIDFYHLRTADGKEVDFLIETEQGYYAFEIKQADHVTKTDARHLLTLAPLLDKPLLQAFVLSNDPQVQPFASNVTAVSVPHFLGGLQPHTK